MKTKANGVVRYNFDGLNGLIRSIDAANAHVIKVGIFGRKTGRKAPGARIRGWGGHRKGKTASSNTNAELGMVHEFGSWASGIPPRPFLRMPLQTQAEAITKEGTVGAKPLLAAGKMRMVLARIGIACENAIQRAFESGGFGKWPKLRPATIKRKGSSAILIDTAQLRRSIASKVDTK